MIGFPENLDLVAQICHQGRAFRPLTIDIDELLHQIIESTVTALNSLPARLGRMCGKNRTEREGAHTVSEGFGVNAIIGQGLEGLFEASWPELTLAVSLSALPGAECLLDDIHQGEVYAEGARDRCGCLRTEAIQVFRQLEDAFTAIACFAAERDEAAA